MSEVVLQGIGDMCQARCGGRAAIGIAALLPRCQQVHRDPSGFRHPGGRDRPTPLAWFAFTAAQMGRELDHTDAACDR